MRVLQITPIYAPSIGGIQDVVRSLAQSLVRADWVCDFAEVNASHRQFSSDRLDSSTVFRVPLHGHRLIGLAPALRRLVKDYDLLHVHDPQVMGLSVNGAFWGRGRPLVMSTHGGFLHTDSHFHCQRVRRGGPGFASQEPPSSTRLRALQRDPPRHSGAQPRLLGYRPQLRE